MKSNNSLNIDNLRIEIAILNKKLSTKTQEPGEFKIPIIMTSDKKGIIHSPATNIRNASTAGNKGSSVNFTDTVTLQVPYYLRLFWGKSYIPKGTKFLVSFTSGNINDGRIIGFYDQEFLQSYVYNYVQLEDKLTEIINLLNKHSDSISSLAGLHDISMNFKTVNIVHKEDEK